MTSTGADAGGGAGADPAGGDVRLPLTGHCGCGAVRFEITARPLSAVYCHCTRCQRRSGTAASANLRVGAEAFRILQGEDRLRSWKPEGGAEKFFCGDCGSALFSRTAPDAPHVGVRLGAIDGDPGIRPSAHQYVAYAAVWEPIAEDGLPRFAESSHPDAAAPADPR